MTIDEALSLNSEGIKPIKNTVIQTVPQYHLDSTPIWREFLAGMRMALKRCKRGRVGLEVVAEHNVMLLHDAISNTAPYQIAMQNAEAATAQDHHWLDQVLLDDEQIRVSLLSAYQGQSIPLHDHPGTNGLLLVVQGKVQISRYDLVHKDSQNENSNVALAKVSDGMRGMGEVDILTNEHGNIHGMRAMTPRCVMLDIAIPPHQKASRNWYLPISSHVTNASHVFARRVTGEYFLPV